MSGGKQRGVVGIIAALLLVVSGLCVNGPLDLYTPEALFTPLIFVFILSALVLLGTGALWLGSFFGDWRHSRTWVPLLMALLSLAASVVIMAVSQFNVHLYGFWVFFSVALLLCSLVVLAVLALTRVRALLKPSTKPNSHGTPTA